MQTARPNNSDDGSLLGDEESRFQKESLRKQRRQSALHGIMQVRGRTNPVVSGHRHGCCGVNSYAGVTQLVRVPDPYSGGCGFNSLRQYQFETIFEKRKEQVQYQMKGNAW